MIKYCDVHGAELHEAKGGELICELCCQCTINIPMVAKIEDENSRLREECIGHSMTIVEERKVQKEMRDEIKRLQSIIESLETELRESRKSKFPHLRSVTVNP